MTVEENMINHFMNEGGALFLVAVIVVVCGSYIAYKILRQGGVHI